MSEFRRNVTCLIVILAGTRLDAGTMTPYEIVVVETQTESLLVVDAQTGSHTEVPIDVPGVSGLLGSIAVDQSNGTMYVYYGFFLDESVPDERFIGSLVAQLDTPTSQWTSIRIPEPEVQGERPGQAWLARGLA